jgi:hypothetical protein
MPEDIKPTEVNDVNDIPPELSKTMDEIIEREEPSPSSFDLTEEAEDVQATEVEDEVVEEEVVEEAVEVDEEDTEPIEGEDVKPEAEVEEGEEIDPRLVRAARKRGYSDERIVELAETSPEILEDIAKLVESVESTGNVIAPQPQVEQPQKQEEVAKELIDNEALKELREAFGDEAANIIAGLGNTITSLSSEVKALRGESEESTQQREYDHMVRKYNTANTHFDEASKEFPELGTSDKLARLPDGELDKRTSEFQTRAQIFRVAELFETQGMSFDAAMKEAMIHYKGKGGEKALKRKVVKDLNKAKKKFSPRPTNKHHQKKYASEEDKAHDTMQDIYTKLGIED